MEVSDGEDIVVLSLSHMVKIRLIGVAAPDKTQSYAAVARQHLADLILNKFVVVRYSALREGYIVGQVLMEKMDVGAQMLRDGVGWYNRSDETLLGEVERQIYQGSQDAARNERRGLWQDESPVAPWDVHKAQLAAVKPAASAPAPTYNTTREHLPRLAASSRRGTAAGLSSEDLMGGVVRPGSIAGKPEVKRISADGVSGRWLRYQPLDKRFSILAPSDAIEVTTPVLLDGQGASVELHEIAGSVGTSFYYVLWFKRAHEPEADADVAADLMHGLLEGINRSAAQSNILVTATPESVLNINGYGGRQYSLDAGISTGTIRIVSKQIGDERELFLIGEMNAVGAEPANADFLNSLKIGRGVSSKQQAAGGKPQPAISSE
ncbi:MAG TPA: thermonuclease family protein [Pyrinomonadaceae bacterium]|jgi:endonuclease YncB( thermonuclease family)|nr:thermonuclease family protein [Pyrinomonadaceae bacterium]